MPPIAADARKQKFLLLLFKKEGLACFRRYKLDSRYLAPPALSVVPVPAGPPPTAAPALAPGCGPAPLGDGLLAPVAPELVSVQPTAARASTKTNQRMDLSPCGSWTTALVKQSAGAMVARRAAGRGSWCRVQDLNPRPSVYKTAALPLC